jgi:hypothetical protein
MDALHDDLYASFVHLLRNSLSNYRGGIFRTQVADKNETCYIQYSLSLSLTVFRTKVVFMSSH